MAMSTGDYSGHRWDETASSALQCALLQGLMVMKLQGLGDNVPQNLEYMQLGFINVASDEMLFISLLSQRFQL